MQGISNNKTLLILFSIALVNILVLDMWLIFNYNSLSETKKIEKQTDSSAEKSPSDSTNVSCPQSCITAIDKATSLLNPTTSIQISPTLKQSSVQTFEQRLEPTQSLDSVKEFYIPLGTGSSTAAVWADVPGVKVEVDSSKYGKIKQVLFEVSTHVPNAQQIVDVRLYNETGNYIVSNSELSFPSGTTQNFRITEVQLGQGKNIYKVQMRTQLQYQAVLDQSRIHVTTY